MPQASGRDSGSTRCRARTTLSRYPWRRVTSSPTFGPPWTCNSPPSTFQTANGENCQVSTGVGSICDMSRLHPGPIEVKSPRQLTTIARFDCLSTSAAAVTGCSGSGCSCATGSPVAPGLRWIDCGTHAPSVRAPVALVHRQRPTTRQLVDICPRMSGYSSGGQVLRVWGAGKSGV